MRIRRIEFFVIALTVAFACFMGGYFLGSRGTVSIIAAPPPLSDTQQNSISISPNTELNVRVENDLPTASPEGTEVKEEPDSNQIIDMQYAANDLPGALRGGDGKININTASRSELMDLPGIGEVLAGRIVDYRNRYGNYYAISDIMKVSGIGEKRFEAIMDKITVG